MASVIPKHDDSAFDRLLREKGFKNRSALAAEIRMTRALLALVPRGYFGSKKLRKKLRDRLGVTNAKLNDVIRRSAEEFLQGIGESG